VASGKIKPTILERVIAGIARACRENATVLLGEETAEMPCFYASREYGPRVTQIWAYAGQHFLTIGDLVRGNGRVLLEPSPA
jgi:phosphoribosylaminoimidazole (AIR) synthetase